MHVGKCDGGAWNSKGRRLEFVWVCVCLNRARERLCCAACCFWFACQVQVEVVVHEINNRGIPARHSLHLLIVISALVLSAHHHRPFTNHIAVTHPLEHTAGYPRLSLDLLRSHHSLATAPPTLQVRHRSEGHTTRLSFVSHLPNRSCCAVTLRHAWYLSAHSGRLSAIHAPSTLSTRA